MQTHNAQIAWEQYREQELAQAIPIIERLGFALSEKQVHVSGERFLMSGKKLVLIGSRTADQKRVILKMSSHPEGIKEIEHEHAARQTLHGLDFAYRHLHTPEEIRFVKEQGMVISVTAFLEEEIPFLKQAPRNQFFLALRAFEMQEGLHITTYLHEREVAGVFGRANAEDYKRIFDTQCIEIQGHLPERSDLMRQLKRAQNEIGSSLQLIDHYGDFLAHTDFVPHNIRIVDQEIYLIDHSSIQFGCKYESWARFINYMVIHHPTLEKWLLQYVKQNRPEEYPCLRIMRIYKLGHLIAFYARSAKQTTGDLQKLSLERIAFWQDVLQAILDDVEVPIERVEAYRNVRDALRSDEEKKRQQELQQL